MSDLKNETTEVVEVTEEVAEKPYTLRELVDEDLYPVIAIVGTVLPEDAKEALVQALDGKHTMEQVGKMIAFDLVKLILKNFKAVKEDVYDLLSDLSGIPANDIKKMPFGTTPKMLKEVFQNERNASFFKEFFKSF